MRHVAPTTSMRCGVTLLLLICLVFSFPQPSLQTLLFISVRSAASHIELRNALRETWLGIGSMTGLDFLSSPKDAIQYRFFVDHVGCCTAEAENHRDLEIVGSQTWKLHPNFTGSYNITAMSSLSNDVQYGQTNYNSRLMHYTRDWHVNIMMRSLELVPTLQYLVQMDDDAVLCTQHLAYQLGRALNPRSPLKRFLFGFKRGTNYDNSFLLMSRDLAEFFQSHYYSELRGTHKYRGSIGASLGTGAGYRDVMEKYGYNLVKRSGNIRGCSEACISKLEKTSPECQCVAASTKTPPPPREGAVDRHFRPTLVTEAECTQQQSRFPDANQCSEKALRSQGIQERRVCLSLYCLKQKDHICRGYPLVDHLPHDGAFKTRLENPRGWRDNSQVCVNKIVFDKVKEPEVIRGWWAVAWPNNKTAKAGDGGEYSYRNLSTFLAAPSTYHDRCILKANRGGGLGRDVV